MSARLVVTFVFVLVFVLVLPIIVARWIGIVIVALLGWLWSDLLSHRGDSLLSRRWNSLLSRRWNSLIDQWSRCRWWSRISNRACADMEDHDIPGRECCRGRWLRLEHNPRRGQIGSFISKLGDEATLGQYLARGSILQPFDIRYVDRRHLCGCDDRIETGGRPWHRRLWCIATCPRETEAKQQQDQGYHDERDPAAPAPGGGRGPGR